MANSLVTQSYNFACVINIPFEGYTKDEVSNSIGEYVSKYEEYYYIYHDKDMKDKVEGIYKTAHFHLLFKCDTKKRVITIINELCDKLFKGNEKYKNCISVRTWVNHDQDIQYLIHKNDSDKFPYNISEIKTNQKDLLIQIMDYDIGLPFDIPKLKSIAIKHVIKGRDGYLDYLEEIGLAKANLYLRVINVVWDYVLLNQSKIMEKLSSQHYQGDNDDLPF